MLIGDYFVIGSLLFLFVGFPLIAYFVINRKEKKNLNI